MAKSIGLVGTLSGKSGNFVFCKGADGRTIVRPYQPQVYNPKTAGQSQQRAKMVLAGMLSSIVPSFLLVGMSAGRKVANRSMFVQNILRKCEVDSVADGYKAGIVGEDIVFSRGVVPLRCTLAAPVLTATKATVTVTPNLSADMVGKCGVRLIALVGEKFEGQKNFKAVSYKDVVFATQSTPESVDIDLEPLTEDVSFVGVYAIPFELSEDAVSQYAGDNGVVTGEVATLAATLRTNSSIVKNWGDSRFVEDFVPFVAG